VADCLSTVELCLREDRREFVSPDPKRFVALAQCGAQSVSKADKGLISGQVTVTVIDVFEIVQVEQDQSELAVVAVRAFNFGPEPMVECPR
jgi:hypothetical protein